MNRQQMRKIIKEVAKSENVSIAEVKRDMQAAVSHAYKNPTLEGLNVPCKGKIPTSKELIEYAVISIIKQNNIQ